MVRGGVMPLKSHLFYCAVTALTCLSLCPRQGQAEVVPGGTGDGVEVEAVQGSLRFTRIRTEANLEAEAPSLQGSLSYRFNQDGDRNSTHVLQRTFDKLKRMDPSVQCSDDEMTLKVKRVSPMHFLVDSGDKPLTPLAEMSSKCGFSMKRSRRDVQYAASYQGCHVTQQGGEYILPLRLWGAPMTMSCPALLPSPSVFCFPSGMVVKVVGITANDLNVKVSSTWTSLSAACVSCGFIVEVFSGGLTLTAPYNRGLCVEMKDDEYLLTLLWTDVELLVTCPSIPNIKPTTTTVTLPSSMSGGLSNPLYSQLLGFSLPTSTQTPPSIVSTMAPFLRSRYLSAVPASMKADTEGLTSDELSSFFISQYSPNVLLPRSELPTQSSTTKSTATLPTLPKLPKSPRYAFSVFPRHSLLPGNFYLTTASPFPATLAQVSVPKSAPISESKEKHIVAEQIEFPYPFLPYLRAPPPPPKDQDHASGDTKPEIHIPELPQLLYPRTYHIPMLYPQTEHPPEKQNSQITTPTTTTTTTTIDTPKKPAAQLAFYHPHTFMQVYYLPQQAALPVLPDPPTTSATNTAPPDQHKHQHISRDLSRLYPFLSHEKLKTAARIW